MISHRALRDIQRCRNKYGETWAEYERQVPYLFIPVRNLSVKLWFITDFLFLVRVLKDQHANSSVCVAQFAIQASQYILLRCYYVHLIRYKPL